MEKVFSHFWFFLVFCKIESNERCFFIGLWHKMSFQFRESAIRWQEAISNLT